MRHGWRRLVLPEWFALLAFTAGLVGLYGIPLGVLASLLGFTTIGLWAIVTCALMVAWGGVTVWSLRLRC